MWLVLTCVVTFALGLAYWSALRPAYGEAEAEWHRQPVARSAADYVFSGRDGSPVAGALVLFFDDPEAGRLVGETTSDESGWFKAPDEGPAFLWVNAHPGDA